MLPTFKKCIEEKNVIVKKTTLGSISVLFKKKLNPASPRIIIAVSSGT